MRKPRDFDAELQALTDKAKTLKDRKLRHLGELVTATGADVLDADTLAGGLLPSSKPMIRHERRAGANAAKPSFRGGHAGLRAGMLAMVQALRRTTAARHRYDAARA